MRAKKLLKKALVNRKATAELKKALAQQSVLAKGSAQIGVYFADSDVNQYQLRQWYEPLAELGQHWPVLMLARNATAALAITQESDLPVAFVPKVSDLESVLDAHPLSIILYVNQNTRNFQMMRYPNRWHVFINHGESDKMYMTSNQYKAYDFAFVAGDAARKRLSAALWDYNVDERTFSIGRPQADYVQGDPPYPSDDRISVLYAPTWEGDRPAAEYGSVASHGVQLAQQILASNRHRLVYRPHPRSGVVDAAYGRANQHIIDMIAEANRADASAHHIYDTSSSLGWQLSAPDIAVCDVSAMIYDRLAVGKPLLVTRPVSSSAELDEGGYLAECDWLDASGANNIVETIDAALKSTDTLTRLAHWSQFHFGNTAVGEPTKRFHDAIAALLKRADAWKSGETSNSTSG
jgi:hypothetical protein